jgi:hypothetical protein
MFTEFLLESLKDRNHLEEQYIDKQITLKWILGK